MNLDPISPGRIEVWMYKFLLGTLSKQKTRLLKEELEKRNRDNLTRSALERKLLAAFTINRPTRKYLAELIDDWEKRNWGD